MGAINPDAFREARIINAMKIAYNKSIEEQKQFYRLAIELCEHYGYGIKDIEKIVSNKL